MFHIIQDEMTTHNCVKELRGALQATNNKLTNTQIQVTELKNQLKEQEREVSRMFNHLHYSLAAHTCIPIFTTLACDIWMLD